MTPNEDQLGRMAARIRSLERRTDLLEKIASDLTLLTTDLLAVTNTSMPTILQDLEASIRALKDLHITAGTVQ